MGADVDSDDEGLVPGGKGGADPESAPRKTKKRRVNFAQDRDDEEAFWLGGNAEGSSTAADKAEPKSARDAKGKKAPLLYRKLTASASTSEAGLLSPPASHRKPAVAPVAAGPSSPSPSTSESLPATPVAKVKKLSWDSDSPARGGLKDSPGNPFVDTPDDGLGRAATLSPVQEIEKEAKEPEHERPFITYVFRGARRTYQNPAYDHVRNRPLSPPPNSKLPVEDPLYSPDPTLKPRLLFPEAHKKRVTRSASKKAALAVRAGDSDSEDGFGPVSGSKAGSKVPMGKIKAPKFAAADREAKGKTKPKSAKKVKVQAMSRKAAAAPADDDVFS